MEKRLKSIKIESINSNYYLHLCKHVSGERFIELEQIFYNNTTNSIKINPNKLCSIITTLENLEKELLPKEQNVSNPELSIEEQKKIIATYLKGISIKDLCLQFRIEEAIIKEILLTNEIVIVEETKKHYFTKNKKRS